ncbi:MAG: hypothetical protein JSU69_01120 [Candidatus Zixiibacteriota bacterium]|nr:MAG: hypothetical protein JSU69_01120 [candidate division Zixibacteria bacterium]
MSKFAALLVMLCLLLPAAGYTDDGCCELAGDANDDGAVNLLDVTYIIDWIYKDGPEPPCFDQADADGRQGGHILDVTYLINYLYKNGPAPVCGTSGE